MKKLIAILFALALVAMLPLTAMAATGINANEQAVLDKLATAIDLGAKGDYVIPQSYINTAKNYFAGDCDMTYSPSPTISTSNPSSSERYFAYSVLDWISAGAESVCFLSSSSLYFASTP